MATLEFSSLRGQPRVLVEATLWPVQGDRFQTTGFPDQGAARYLANDGSESLIVKSEQSIANRLELVCWNEATEDLAGCLQGLPYVRVVSADGGRFVTASLLEPHRINSPYILDDASGRLLEYLRAETASASGGLLRPAALARVVSRYDVGCILHGVFLARKNLAGGRLRLTRALSGFIQADHVRLVESSGVKMDRLNPSGEARGGFGNVIFRREQFVADKITAFFNLDLSLLASYGLGDEAENLFMALAFYKIERLLSAGLRLRSACDLDVKEVRVTRPAGFVLPDLAALEQEMPPLIAACTARGLFVNPPVTTVVYEAKAGAKDDKSEADEASE